MPTSIKGSLNKTVSMIFFCASAAVSLRAAPNAQTFQWFQKTEQALFDAIATGDKQVWDNVMDSTCVVTDEEGGLVSKQEFLNQLRGLPPGLSGKIIVKDLTVQNVSDISIVRFVADETETVFGQQLNTRYRVTDVFGRDGSTWKMFASHASVVTSDPPAQDVSKDGWAALVGDYQLKPNGWTMHVELRDGQLYGGRDPKRLRPFIPLTSDAFVLKQSLGEWIFVLDKSGSATQILNFRKFEPIVWKRITP